MILRVCRLLVAAAALIALVPTGPVLAQAEAEQVKQWKQQARAGDSEAQFLLGDAYLNGHGVDQDVKTALEWLDQAAEHGHALAQLRLGMYYTARTDPAEREKAIAYFRRAAAGGQPPAQLKLGQLYMAGIGDPESDPQAEAWLRTAAERTNAAAKYTLAVMYLEGRIVPQSDAEALGWMRKAIEQSGEATVIRMLEESNLLVHVAELGLSEAQFGVANLYSQGRGVPKSGSEAVRWYRKAAEAGVLRAQLTLGHIFSHGVGVPKNMDEAIRWYLEAARRGDAEAQLNLGFIFSSGQDTPADLVQAHMWFNLASAAGLKDAARRRDALVELMSPEDLALAEQRAIEWTPAE